MTLSMISVTLEGRNFWSSFGASWYVFSHTCTWCCSMVLEAPGGGTGSSSSVSAECLFSMGLLCRENDVVVGNDVHVVVLGNDVVERARGVGVLVAGGGGLSWDEKFVICGRRDRRRVSFGFWRKRMM